MIPVVDIFAGPGGLGEGFSSWRDPNGRRKFHLAVSIEKDADAHATLRLRAFRRCFGERVPGQYERLLKGEIGWDILSTGCKAEARKAETEARRIELGRGVVDEVRALIRGSIAKGTPWVLIGGPPCQAYSVVGRARNRGIANYRPDQDHRQTLYLEYLQVLADHAPHVFVMENVKGLLSAQFDSQRMFDRIRHDLGSPVAALKRERRPRSRFNPKYEIRAVVAAQELLGYNPQGFLVRAEHFGIPQCRHRIILVGVREDIASRPMKLLERHPSPVSVSDVIGTLPKVRSGLSREADSDAAWHATMLKIRSRGWMRQIDRAVREKIEETLNHLSVPEAARGAEYTVTSDGNILLNHSTRAHMPADLERYLFASASGFIVGRSPVLDEFPEALLPEHGNVSMAIGRRHFSDRFRVQVAGQPATTVTSHIAKDGNYFIHYDPSQCRSLTVREAARLQTFPDDYFFCGSRTSQYRQVGNAVPPELAKQIAGVVAGILSG